MRIKIKQLLLTEKLYDDVTVIGHVKTCRKSKKLTFIKIDDGSDVRGLQVISLQNIPCTVGMFMKITGKIVKSPAKEQNVELQLENYKIYGNMDSSKYPLSKKHHTKEHVRKFLHLRSRTSTHNIIMRIRSTLAFATHQFYKSHDFKYIHTPIITSNDCEGAGETIKLNSQDFFHKKVGLTVSGQLHVETSCLGLCDVYTFGPTFRAEKSETSRHLAEFWMIEPEMVTENLNDLLDLAEDYIKFCVNSVLNECEHDLNYLDKKLFKKLTDLIKKKYVRISYENAIQLLQSHISEKKIKFNNKIVFGCDLASEHEKYLTNYYNNIVIVCNYPENIKSFYMKSDNDKASCFDILVPGIGELIGGSLREEDYNTLLNKMKKRNMNIEKLQWYLDLRKFSTVPHGGFGLGFERLVMLCTNVENIRDVIPYPRYYKHCAS